MVDPGGGGESKAFSDERAVAQTGLRSRQAGDSRQLTGQRQSRSLKEASGDLLKRGLAINLLARLFRESAFSQRPDVGELGEIDDFAGDHDHGNLQFVDRFVEQLAI